MQFDNRNVLITGCNRGIGKQMVEGFAKEGATVIAHARKSTDEFSKFIEGLEAKYGTSIIPVYFDLDNEDEIKSAIKAIIIMVKRIDILVNNAGMVGANSLFHMTRIEDMKKVFNVNFFAPMLITQMVSRVMMKYKSGSIINIASVAGLDGDPAQLEYSTSKAAIICATKKLAIELGTYGIRVNAVAPGRTDTDMLDHMSDETEKETENRSIIKRRAKPQEIVEVVIFLASDKSSFVTGQTWRVDGGMHM